MLWRLIADAAGALGAARERLVGLWTTLGLDRLTERTPATRRIAFTIAVVALAAKLAKADGVATEIEAATFARCFAVGQDELGNVRRVFDFAARDAAGYESYAEDIGRLLKDDPEILRDVFECLFHVAAADGVLHGAEETFLRTVAEKFGIDEATFRTVRRLFVADAADPYEVLGVPPGMSAEHIKARHRELVRESHPDRLAAHGVPEEFRTLADRKLAAINAAYDAIRKERGIGARR